MSTLFTSRRDGADACPGVLAVHPAADGGLARVRVPGGALSTDALRTLAAAAADLGAGVLELTSRANVQVRGLRAGTVDELGARLHAAGLLPSATHDRVRNIVASPLTGRRGDAHPDVTALVAALDAAICADPMLTELGGRFLITVDDGAADVTALGADIALFAAAGRYLLALGGLDTGMALYPDRAVDAVLAAARGFLAERTAQHGTAWRLHELDDGPRRVAARVHATVPTTAIPTTAGAGIPADALTVPRPPPPGPHPQPDGRIAVCAVAPGGRLDAAATDALLAAAPAGVRLTPWRRLLLPDLPRDRVEQATAGLNAAGLDTDPASPWARVSTCAGRPGCAHARADVRADATPTAPLPATAAPDPAALDPAALDPAADPDVAALPVHWSACERRCGRPAGEHVEVVAEPTGYRTALAGRP